MSPDHFDERAVTGERPYKPKTRPDFAVQTGQDTQSLAEQVVGTGSSLAVCLRAPRSGKLRVVWAGTEAHRELLRGGWEVAEDVVLRGACSCGCGLPIPHAGLSVNGREYTNPLQRYADPEACRRALYALQHPTLDLSGMAPVQAKNAARMASEAVRAARMGQARATVDAHAEVEHESESRRGIDKRPSCRLRLTPYHWQLLSEIQAFWSREVRTSLAAPSSFTLSFSEIAMMLIETEAQDINARKKQEGEHDGITAVESNL